MFGELTMVDVALTGRLPSLSESVVVQLWTSYASMATSGSHGPSHPRLMWSVPRLVMRTFVTFDGTVQKTRHHRHRRHDHRYRYDIIIVVIIIIVVVEITIVIIITNSLSASSNIVDIIVTIVVVITSSFVGDWYKQITSIVLGHSSTASL